MAEHGKPDGERWTVAADFDGVIHSYTSPWVAPEVIPDPPVEGSMEWLNLMATKFNVGILTTRGQTPEGAVACAAYIVEHGGPVPWIVTDRKFPALLYVDDRGWRFGGSNFPSIDDVHRARPWNKPEPMVVPPVIEPGEVAEVLRLLGSVPYWDHAKLAAVHARLLAFERAGGTL